MNEEWRAATRTGILPVLGKRVLSGSNTQTEMRGKIGIAICTLGFALAGCSSPQVQLIGRFELSPTAAPLGDSRMNRLARELTSNSTLEFRPDGVCTVSLETRTVVGRYRMAGRNVTVEIDNGKDLAGVPPFQFLLIDGGKTLVGTMFGEGERFTKV